MRPNDLRSGAGAWPGLGDPWARVCCFPGGKSLLDLPMCTQASLDEVIGKEAQF